MANRWQYHIQIYTKITQEELEKSLNNLDAEWEIKSKWKELEVE